MTGKWRSESDLAAAVVLWLQEQHWEVYQEVRVSRQGSIADIVGVNGRLVWVIECKLSLGLQLMAQAMSWLHRAHYVSVAVPLESRASEKSYWYAERILSRDGIGLIKASPDGRVSSAPPALHRAALGECIRKALHPEQKTAALAGSNQGGYWTPFKSTCLEIRKVVAVKPGICLKELLASIKTHYSTPSTARACISDLAQKGIIKGIRTARDGKLLRFYLEAE